METISSFIESHGREPKMKLWVVIKETNLENYSRK